MTEVVDTLVTELEFKADTKLIAATDKQLAKLEKQAKATATATDVLADEQANLAQEVQNATEKEQKLRREQSKLRKEIQASKKPTDDQRKALRRVGDELEDASEQTRRYRNELKRLGIQQAKINRQSRKEQGSIRSLAGARRSAGNRAAAAPSGGGGGLAGAAAAAGPVGAALAGIGTAAAGAAAAIGTVIQTGAEMEGLRARLKTVEGSVVKAGEAFTLLKGIAKETPFELQDVTTAYVRLKSLGIQPTEASLKSFGNIAAAQGKPLIDFVEAVGDAATGEFERLKEFGIKASSQGEQVAFTFGGVTTRVKKDAKEITKFLESIGQTQFAGAMADQMNTFGGQVSNLKDTWTNFLDEIARLGVLDEAKLLLKELSGTMGDEMIPIIADLIKNFLQALRETFVEIRDGGGGLIGTLQTLSDVIGVLSVALSPLIALWQGMVAVLQHVVEVGGFVFNFIDNMLEALGKLLEPLKKAVGQFERLNAAWDKAKDFGGGIISTIDGVTASLFSQAEAIAVVKGSLEDLQAQIALKTLADDLGLVGAIKELSDTDLQTLRQAGGKSGTQAEAEIAKRIKAREQSDKNEESAKKKQAFDKKKADRAGDVAKDFDGLSDKQLASFATDPNVSKKLRDKAANEQLKRSKKGRKKGAAAGKKMRDATLIADINKQIEKNARQLAQAEAARGLRSGKLTASTAGEFETRRFKEIKEKQTRAFQDQGRLPAGIAQDVRQIAALPSINDLAGRTAPPVISNTINNFDFRDNEFNSVIEGGTFEGTPQEFARQSLAEHRKMAQRLLGESVPSFRTQEVR